MKTLRAAWRVLGGFVVATLGACHSLPTRLYGIDPTLSATQISSFHAPALRIDTLSVPAAWDRLEILSVSATGNIEIHDFDHWSAPLAQIARQALSDDLDRRLPSGSVIYPRLPKPPGALGVNVDILDFNVIASKASMRVSWTIVADLGSKSVKRSVAYLQGPTISAEPREIAHAWSELIGQLADRIAVDATSFDMP